MNVCGPVALRRGYVQGAQRPSDGRIDFSATFCLLHLLYTPSQTVRVPDAILGCERRVEDVGADGDRSDNRCPDGILNGPPAAVLLPSR